MSKYEYQVMEADSPSVPAYMLTDVGDKGWRLCGVIPNRGEVSKWVFYFVREKDSPEAKQFPAVQPQYRPGEYPQSPPTGTPVPEGPELIG